MRQYLFTSEFFDAFPEAGKVELPVALTIRGRQEQSKRRHEFIRQHIPDAHFCTMFTRNGPIDKPDAMRVEFHFSTVRDATFFLLGAVDL